MKVVCRVSQTVKGGRFLRHTFLSCANVPRLEGKACPKRAFSCLRGMSIVKKGREGMSHTLIGYTKSDCARVCKDGSDGRRANAGRVYAGRSCRPPIGGDGGDIRDGLEADRLHWIGMGEEDGLDSVAAGEGPAARGERGCLTDVRLECVGEVALPR